ncbi:hypothetical protein LTR36_008744 [Oleoguttula mirabilis]|uniref:DNA replication regulator SLD2 n=1 Tax=Oleoguttula mirabilis TaxID=1507867 RepID=A0AAV9JTF3_9PEZI|nr:hypothetical protein LTR36_008744 [Oleoguttula mirabilis]
MASGSQILEQQVAALKHELKCYEKSFAAANNGQKPAREHIRRDATISAKYREYDRLRRPTSFAKPAEQTTPRKQRLVRPGSAHKRTALRERPGNAATATSTPNKPVKSAIYLEVVAEEEEEVEATPAFIRCALGPTPQKDGQVLGIFDMPAATPSKKTSSLATVPELPPVSGTPSKAATSCDPILSATPRSSSRRRLFEAFAGTPLKRKREDDGHTPTSSKRQFSTPSFLRRAFPLAPIDEECTTAAGPPFAKRGLVRSLSSIIKGLRKQEDKRMDDEWDILDELEAEERGELPFAAAAAAAPAKVLVEDSQVAGEMPLGPDQGEPESDDEEQSTVRQPGVDANGKPRKPWKKKGLKRQTKRTNMRPVLHKARKASDLAAEEDKDDGAEVVAETQPAEAPPTLRLRKRRLDDKLAGSEASGEDDGASEYDNDDDDNNEAAEAEADIEPGAAKANKNREAAKRAEAAYQVAKADQAKHAAAEQKPEKARKKVSAQAHANFRALKIKNKNSKGNGKGGGRKFGGRR